MRTPRLLATAAALLLLAPLAACSSSMTAVPDIAAAPMPEAVIGSDSSLSTAIDMSAAARGESGAVDAQQGRSVISTGSISIEVDDAGIATDEVAGIVADLGGYVESQTLDRASGTHAELTVRVPAEQFDAAFIALGELGTISDERRSSSDVTMQHVDLQARVDALEASVTRLTELMNGAATTSELLEAELALSQRQAELDSLTAQLRSLEGQIGESTIWVALFVKTALPGGSGPSNFWEGLVAGFDSFIAFIAGAVVVLGVLLPWLIVLAIIALAIILPIRGARRRRRAREAALAPQATQQHTPPQAEAHQVAPSPAQTQAPSQTQSPPAL